MKYRKNREKRSHSRYAYRNPFLYRKSVKHPAAVIHEKPVSVDQVNTKKSFIARQKDHHRNEIQERNARIEMAVMHQEEVLGEVRTIRDEKENLKKQLNETRKSFRQAKKDYKVAKKNTRTAKKKNYGVWTSLLAGLICYLGILLMLTVRWLFETWPKLQMDELIFQLSMSFQGTGGGMVEKFLVTALLPSLLCLMGIVIILYLLACSGKRVRNFGKSILVLMGVIAIACSSTIFCSRMDVMTYLNNQKTGSDFIEKNYVDPASVEITFPQKKRNLVMIYLESMETTYAPISFGGAFETGVIPELTELALANESFSGDENIINGGVSMPGTTWTMGGLFAATSGLPLQIDISANNMDTQTSFFPGITTMGDILNEAGYTSVFACGSDGVFGGRQLYFTTHGDYQIHDINYYKSQGILDEDYYVWWGFEDEKLLSYAKDELSELAAADEPFNYTLLTVDTHFEDGYLCDLCEDEYGDQYSNVMACSSRQVSEFVEWIQQQDWYENTTIVITGDHPTMDSDFCNDIDEDYQRRVYTAYINAAPLENETVGMRSFTTFDTFPTVLSSLGVQIEGNRLGLGTDLFSGTMTMLEKSSVVSLSAELSKSSAFMREKASIEQDTDALIARSGIAPGGNVILQSYDVETQMAHFSVEDIFYLSGSIEEMRLSSMYGEDVISEVTMEYEGCGRYEGSVEVPLSHIDDISIRIDTDVRKENETKTVNIFSHTGNLYLYAQKGNSFLEFLKGVDELDLSRYTVFMTVQSEAGESVSADVRELLMDMSLSNLISSRQPASYVIMSDEGIRSGSGKDYVRENGYLSDGVPYVISSSANEEQSSSIIVGYGFNDYSLHQKGINVVIYDHLTDEIVCQKAFSTEAYSFDSNITVEKASIFAQKYSLKVTDLKGVYTVSRVLARIYDVSDPSFVKEQYLNLNFDHEFEAEIDLTDHRKEDIIISIYVEDTDFRYHEAGYTTIVNKQ